VIHIKLDNVLIPTTTFQAKKVGVIGGRARMFDTQKAKDVKSWWLFTLEPHRPKSPIKGPVKIIATFVWPAPASTPKKVIRENPAGIFKSTKPDLGNVTKALYDALEQLGYIVNDSQIALEIITKRLEWTPSGRLSIYIIPLSENTDPFAI